VHGQNLRNKVSMPANVVIEVVNMSEYERWENRFSRAAYEFGEEPAVFLTKHAHRLPKTGRALAVSDGEGRNGVWLARQGLTVTSMDFSPAAQAKARTLAVKHGVSITTELADILTYVWPTETYDVIAAIFFQFLGPADRHRVFRHIRNALMPGGLLLMTGYTPKQLVYGTGGPKAVENLYTRELLRQEFAGFSKVEIDEYEAVLAEGAGHSGMSAVIDMVAVK
jgi:cyclopropane fatty-acyl-phospholipid synthase-like methyltransferase